MELLESFLMLFGGLGVFLVGIKAMGDNLEALAGNKLKNVFNKISNNRFSGVAIGAGITAVIQSSSATTVMVVGFVNAGVMTLMQATGIIMGANIGTTITAQITALQQLPVAAFFASMACVGAFMQMSKKDHINKLGAIIGGIGVLFVGLHVMGGSMNSLKDSPVVSNAISSAKNPFLLFLLGMVFTAIIQSSSATTTILISLGAAGLVDLRSAIFVTIGINIGTCITAVLASIGATTNGKRASVIHLLFNCIGSLLFFIIALCLPASAYTTLEGTFGGLISTQIAMFHTLFNVTTTILLLPFVKQLTKLSTLIVRDKKPVAAPELVVPATQTQTESADSDMPKTNYIDERFLGTPSIAIMMVRKEILSMAAMAKTNLDLSMQYVTTLDMAKLEEFRQREANIDYLNAQITRYLVKISSMHISYLNEREVASYYHVVSDIERVGDYAENIVEYAQELINADTRFSDTAVQQVLDMKSSIDKLYESVVQAFAGRDLSMQDTIQMHEDRVDAYQEELAKDHVSRLSKGECSAEAAGVFLSLISNLERIADHFRNVFSSMKTYAQAPMRTKATVVEEPKQEA